MQTDAALGTTMSTHTLVPLMLRSADDWQTISSYVANVIATKEADERLREREQNI